MWSIVTTALALSSYVNSSFPLLTATQQNRPSETSRQSANDFIPNRDSTKRHVGPVITPEFSSFVEGLLSEHSVKGLSLVVVRKGEKAEYGSWGDRTEDGDKVSAETLFSIGSCSKAFLASSMGILIDDFKQGKNVTALPNTVKNLDWTTKIADLLPDDWRLMDEWANEKANIKDLLSHSSGLAGHDLASRRGESSLDLLRRLRHFRTPYELRERNAYNNLIYTSASYIIAKYSGVPYTDFVEKRIFSPLGMNYSTFSPAKAEASGKLSQSWSADGRRLPHWDDEETIEANAGPGGIQSNSIDLAKWLDLLLNEGVNSRENETVIPKSGFEAVTSATVITAGRPTSADRSITGYGMGWGRFSYRSHDVVTHSGGVPAFLTYVGFFPSDGVGIAVMINTWNPLGIESKVAYRAFDSALDLSSGTTNIDIERSANKPGKQLTPKIDSSQTISSLVPSVSLAGTYTNIGYGNITLCEYRGPLSYFSSAESQIGLDDNHCASVRRAFSMVDPYVESGDRYNAHQLIAEFKSLWTTHLRFVRSTSLANSFQLYATNLFPNGFGKNQTPFEFLVSETGSKNPPMAIFDVKEDIHTDGMVNVKGVSLFNIIRDVQEDGAAWAATEKPLSEALVWFNKID